MSDRPDPTGDFPDWTQATQAVKVTMRTYEQIVLDQPYHANHKAGPVQGGAGDILCRWVDDPEDVFVEPAPSPAGEPGVATIVGEPIILEDEAAEAFLAGLAGATDAQAAADEAFGHRFGGPAADVEAIDVTAGMEP